MDINLYSYIHNTPNTRYNVTMKELIIISDSHGIYKPLINLLSKHQNADYFIHLGDSELDSQLLSSFMCVRGNCDYDDGYPYDLCIDIDSHRLLLTHGHRYHIKKDYCEILTKAKQEKCDIICFGHTHRYVCTQVEGITLLNPGSILFNRDGTAPSYMSIKLDSDKIITTRLTF